MKGDPRLCISAGIALATLATSFALAQDSDLIKIGFLAAPSGWMADYDGNPHKGEILKIEVGNKASYSDEIRIQVDRRQLRHEGRERSVRSG